MQTYSAYQPPSFECPHCQQTDKVQKASGIWRAAATYSASRAALGRYGSGVSPASPTARKRQIALAKRLNPPRKSFPFGVVLMVFSVLPWLLKIRVHPVSSLEWFELGSALAVFLFTSGVLLIGIHLARLPQYRSEAQRWGCLYYCSRCDDAFEVG